MSDIPIGYLFAALFFLILLSAFFSSSETGMMALNRYRLRHLTKQKHKGAMRATRLLQRPDRLIGVILIGNNFVNILASAIATVLALHYFGDAGLPIATAVLTLTILIFAEVTPKTVAAAKPETIAFAASFLLRPLQTLLYPLVWVVNSLCNGILRLFGFNIANHTSDNLSSEELRTLVNEAGSLIPRRNQSMMLGILDLESVTVEDVMIPRNEIVGIDLEDGMEVILAKISNTPHTRLPLYKGELHNIVGIIHVRNILPLMQSGSAQVEDLLKLARDPYFIPESTPLNTQLVNFQKSRHWMALVVDEYGDIQGLTTLEDILEEIVGDLTEAQDADNEDIVAQEDGSYFIDGTTTIRDINKALHWDLPVDGPKTLNGLITESLEEIPQHNVCLLMAPYILETIHISGHFIKTIRMQKIADAHTNKDD